MKKWTNRNSRSVECKTIFMTHKNEAIGQKTKWAAAGSAWRGRLFHSATFAKKNAAGEVVFKESSESYLIFEAWREPRGTLPNKQPQSANRNRCFKRQVPQQALTPRDADKRAAIKPKINSAGARRDQTKNPMATEKHQSCAKTSKTAEPLRIRVN